MMAGWFWMLLVAEHMVFFGSFIDLFNLFGDIFHNPINVFGLGDRGGGRWGGLVQRYVFDNVGLKNSIGLC